MERELGTGEKFTVISGDVRGNGPKKIVLHDRKVPVSTGSDGKKKTYGSGRADAEE